MRDLFQRSVVELKGDIQKILNENQMNDYLTFDEALKINDEFQYNIELEENRITPLKKLQDGHSICRTCFGYLRKSKMPPMCSKNALEPSVVPNCLKNLTNLEKQLIVKNLVFIKIRQLPKTRMEAMNDRVINVPITDDNIAKRVTSLPRTEDNSGLVNVGLKRKLNMKNYHKHGLINPDRVYHACEYLVKHHPAYKNIKLTNYEEWAKNCPTLFSHTDKSDEEEAGDSSEEETVEKSFQKNTDKKRVQGEADDNDFNAVTCLYPKEPASEMIVNHSDKMKKIKFKRKAKKIYDMAPGQGQVPTNWIREKDHDQIAFPELFTDGKGGVNYDRKIKLVKGDFYSTRFLNHDKRYAKNSDYLFVAQQHLERHLLENNISIAGQKGKVSQGPEGTKTISCNNAFDVFGKIPGTPQYWKQYRNELFARMEQLGAFHFFFTLSAAEMRWPEVTTAILHYEQQIDKIVYQPGWEESEEKIKIYFMGWDTGEKDKVQTLKYFKENQKDKHKFYKDHFLLITRLFDNRVKAFISNILMANEDVEHYSYRIEFQVRGLPHLHGVFWLTKKAAKKYQDGNGEFLDTKVPELIDKWISCSLATGNEELDKLVKEVNVHKHTKSCQKGNNPCRFNYPRLPSNRTLISNPPCEIELGKTKCDEIKHDAKEILKKVKKQLSDMTDEELHKSSLEKVLELVNEQLDEDEKISSDKYHEALSISERGKTVVLKRKPNEMWVNNYNPHFMKAWKANIDIQFCLDTYAVITYITDYLTKGDAGLTKELRKALKETKHCNNFEQLNHLKMVYFKHKQVSVAEATYRLIRGLDLKKSNIACIYVATGYPRNRSTFFRPATTAEKSTDVENIVGEEQPMVNENDNIAPVTIEGKQGQFKEVESIHQKYSQRPESLNDVCLAQFSTSYTYTRADKIPKKTEWVKNASAEKGDLNVFGSKTEFLPKYIELDSGTFMALRTKPFVLRIHSSKKKEYLEGVYSELLLYLPWRDESELMEGKEKQCIDLFTTKEKIINENRMCILPNAPMIDAMMELLDAPDGTNPLHVADGITTDADQANLDDQVELEETNPLDTSDLPVEAGDKTNTRMPDGL